MSIVTVVTGALVIQAALLARSTSCHSPTWDEVAHLAAGVSHWRFGEFALYAVNPPLVRTVAASPFRLAETNNDWREYDTMPHKRLEFAIGRAFVRQNGASVFATLTIARWACIPLSLIGAYVCFGWARELYGDWAGVTAMGLWCFSPTVLGYGALITPDCGAAALGIAAAYAFRRWMCRPDWVAAFWAGLWLGLAELTKFTWIVLFALWPCPCGKCA